MASSKKALITGITGQDGSYLAELLASKGYAVYGIVRRTSSDPMYRISDLRLSHAIKLVEGNLRDLSTIRMAMEEIKPDEVYNLAAQSHVGTSFKCPDETWEINYYGAGRVFNEALRVNPSVRIYQASTSEMFGNTPAPQHEESGFAPVSPYAEAKLKTHEDFVVGYRTKYGHHISSGILFNHESPRRGRQFVTRKITHSFAKIMHGLQENFGLGNLDAKRDWGYAADYVEAMWRMLQKDVPDDYVIATGETHSVRDFVEAVAMVHDIPLVWEGEGENEVGRNTKTGHVVVAVSPEFYRPNEVNHLIGKSDKAQEKLGWKPTVTFSQLVEMMAKADYELVRKGL